MHNVEKVAVRLYVVFAKLPYDRRYVHHMAQRVLARLTLSNLESLRPRRVTREARQVVASVGLSHAARQDVVREVQFLI